MIKLKKNLQPIIGKNEGVVPFKYWQYIPPFKRMHDYTRSQNLGQTYNGVEKYKSMNGEMNTGYGYGFEDLTEKQLISCGDDVQKVCAEKNGADYLVNGRPTQMKCSNSSEKGPGTRGGETARKFCVGGNLRKEYRYFGQDACVPRGEAKYVREEFNNRERNGFGKSPVVVESPVSVSEAVTYTYKGKESFKMDMKDPNLVVPAVEGGLVVGGATYVAARIMIANRCKKKGKEMTWKHELLAAGIGTLSAVASAAGALAAECSSRQDLRPDRV